MATGDFTPGAAAAIDLCKSWADELSRVVPADIYLFGSAIYEGGDQFDAELSDLDLVVVFNEDLDALKRAERLLLVRAHKLNLEINMVPHLHRTNCSDPGVSILPITKLELQANIHKSGAPHFFDRNVFFNLATQTLSLSLLGAGTHTVEEAPRQALEYSQKIRNQFLALSANRTGGIAPFDGADPLPKALARSAAQLVPDAKAGAWYDTRFGLEYLNDALSAYRSDPSPLGDLCKKLSVRRGGRGQRLPLTDFDQLLLAEILYDRAAAKPPQPLTTWEIRFASAALDATERERLIEKLRDLIPAAEIVGIYEGSIIVRLRSSKRTYLMVARLFELRVLNAYFDAGEIEVAELHGDAHEGRFQPNGTIDRVADYIRNWRPLSNQLDTDLESSLAQWLATISLVDPEAGTASITREARVPGTSLIMRADILISFPLIEPERNIVVELVRIRYRSRFFNEIERLERIPVPVVLVLVGTAELLRSLAPDIQKLSDAAGAVRVVSVALDDG